MSTLLSTAIASVGLSVSHVCCKRYIPQAQVPLLWHYMTWKAPKTLSLQSDTLILTVQAGCAILGVLEGGCLGRGGWFSHWKPRLVENHRNHENHEMKFWRQPPLEYHEFQYFEENKPLLALWNFVWVGSHPICRVYRHFPCLVAAL